MINCAFVVFCNLLDTDYCCHQKLKDPFTHCDRGFFLFTFKCLCVSRWSQIPTWHTLTRYDTLLSLPVNKAVCIRDKKKEQTQTFRMTEKRNLSRVWAMRLTPHPPHSHPSPCICTNVDPPLSLLPLLLLLSYHLPQITSSPQRSRHSSSSPLRL